MSDQSNIAFKLFPKRSITFLGLRISLANDYNSLVVFFSENGGKSLFFNGKKIKNVEEAWKAANNDD